MATPSISVIMPVYNGISVLPRSLPPLIAMLRRGEVSEVIVVDDTSSDNTAELARGMGANVIPSGGRLGPGGARNVAARTATGEILWFVDADVIAHDGGADLVRAAFLEPGAVAVFGSYDDKPPATNFGSQYKNLVHHHYHQAAPREAATFWAGCGAILKKAYLAVGGFDSVRYKVPSIEDIELGYRLRDAGGRIVFEPRLLGTHLKMWTMYDLVRTDIFRRALPWSRLMLSRSQVSDNLNVSRSERLKAGLAGLAVLGLAGASTGILPPAVALLLLISTFVANSKLFALFLGRGGMIFAICGLLFHQLYYCYSTASFLWCWAEGKVSRLAR